MVTITETKKKLNTTQKEIYRVVTQGFSIRQLEELLNQNCQTTKERYKDLINGKEQGNIQEFVYMETLVKHKDIQLCNLIFQGMLTQPINKEITPNIYIYGSELTNYADKHGV